MKKADLIIPIRKKTKIETDIEEKTITSKTIKWFDAWSDETKTRYNLTNTFHPIIRYSSGFVIYEDDTSLVLAMNYWGQYGNFSNILCIPKNCIIGE